MKKIEKTVNAVTDSGAELTMNVIATRGWEKVTEALYNDGWESEVETMKDINKTDITINVKGMIVTGTCFETRVPADLKAKGVVALFGKLGLTKRVYSELAPVVEAAMTEAETDESWIRLQQAKAEAIKNEEAYQAHVNGVERMMTAGY